MGAADLLLDVRRAGFALDVANGMLLVTPASMLTDELRAALRACKPELIELLTAPMPTGSQKLVRAQACADCQHLGPRGTCFEPVAAGLRSEQEGFGIAWPPDDHAQSCTAFGDRPVARSQDRPHKLTREQLAAASVEP